jgi:hypothetical protein
MNFEEVKASGAPFPAAEIQISVRKRIARLICITPDHTNPPIDFKLDESDGFEVAAASTLEAARDLGLLENHCKVSILNLDSAVPN